MKPIPLGGKLGPPSIVLAMLFRGMGGAEGIGGKLRPRCGEFFGRIRAMSKLIRATLKLSVLYCYGSFFVQFIENSADGLLPNLLLSN